MQGLQAFTFSVVTVNDEHMKPRFISMFQKKAYGLNLKIAYAPNRNFLMLQSQDRFENGSPEKSPKQSLPKVLSEAALSRSSK